MPETRCVTRRRPEAIAASFSSADRRDRQTGAGWPRVAISLVSVTVRKLGVNPSRGVKADVLGVRGIVSRPSVVMPRSISQSAAVRTIVSDPGALPVRADGERAIHPSAPA